MEYKKEIYLGVAAIALYLAAREYGINSLSDAKRKLGPYLKWVDVIDAITKEEQPRQGQGRQAVTAGRNFEDRNGHSEESGRGSNQRRSSQRGGNV